jgi:ribosomal protein L3 glutamine methyltransferase
VAAIIAKRISTRKPAPYLTNEAWVQGHAFYVDERVIVPRSYIGELLGGRLSAAVADPDAVDSVLDLCTGSGCLAILDALAVAERNVNTYDLGGRIGLVWSNLFAALPGRRYDLILSNPPYVSSAAVAAFPPEYAAEPRIAHAGGEDGLDIVLRILAEAGAHLTEKGVLVVEIGTGRDVLEGAFPRLPFLWLDSAQSEGEVFALTAKDLRGRKGR